MSGALVSVIVPVYNAELFLRRTVNSILEQTYRNIEVILVDDGSTDKSGEICDAFALRDKRIKSYHNTNHGVSYARNYGIDVARGEYVHFVDADDVIPPDFVELMLNNITAENSDVVFCGWAKVFEYTEYVNRLEDRTYSVENYFIALYKGERLGSTSSCIGMYKMAVIRDHKVRFPEDLRCGEDAIFVVEYMKHVNKISSIKNVVYYYMDDNENSCTKNIFYDHYQMEQRRYDEVCGIIDGAGSLRELSFCYIDQIIRELVTYVKYAPETVRETKRNLKAFVDAANTRMAISHYHRNSPKKSFWIPIAIRYRMAGFLYVLLKRRKMRVTGHQTVRSVWN
ncbi:MAG: glycosyltransferase [Roseburia sp.]|nr:glycosyltransferase [Roseburia sp.]